jgi:large subunit ribosomal protein L30
MPATLRLQYYRSAIGRSWRQKAIIRGLGFTKLQQIVVRPDNAGFRGMVAKVPHLVRIVPASEKAQPRS